MVDIKPLPLNASKVTNLELKALNKLFNQIAAERDPEEPARTVEQTTKHIRALAHHEDLHFHVWLAWHGDEAIAFAVATIEDREENKHLMWLGLDVLPAYRRQGIATRLLHKIVKVAKDNNKQKLMNSSHSNAPAGGAFAEHIGAEKGQETHTNKLDLRELDKNLLEAWIEGAKKTASEFELGLWDGVFPEEEIAAIADMMQVMTTQPRDNLDIEDWKVTPKQLRSAEAYLKETSKERWVYYARHKASGELAGYTMVFFDPADLNTVDQDDTGVLPKYRGHGLGKWLKAAMLAKILNERPEARRVLTGNADSNVHMLAINHDLGFKPHLSWSVWQIELEKIEAYLAPMKVEEQ